MRVRFVLIIALIFLQIIVTPTLVNAAETYTPFDNVIPKHLLPENCSWATVDEPFDDGPDYYKIDTFNVTSLWNTLIIQANTSTAFLDIHFYHNDTLFSTYRFWFDNVTIFTFIYPYDALHLRVSSAVRGSQYTMSFWNGNTTTLPIFTVIPDTTTIIQNVTVTQNITYTETVIVIQNVTQYIVFWNTSYVYHTETVVQYLPLLSDYSLWLPFTGGMIAVGSVIILYLWNSNNNKPTPRGPSPKEILEEIFDGERSS